MHDYVNSSQVHEREKGVYPLRNSIVSKGKNVKEAVNTALHLLNDASIEDVDIEIMESESKGILGIGSKPAVVRVTLKHRGRDHRSEDTMSTPTPVVPLTISEVAQVSDSVVKGRAEGTQEEYEGKVWVKEGQIFVKDGPDKYPLVLPRKGLNFFKNNEAVEHKALIRESDVLEVELRDEERAPSWELHVSDDKMAVTVKVTPGVRIFRRLKDIPPSECVQLEVEEKVIPIIIETGPILNKLKELGVVYGIDYTELTRACTSEVVGSFMIAKGTPPVMGNNGRFEVVQEVEIKKGLKERSDGSIDYREIQQFPSVEHGQVLGLVHPPVAGIPGKTVTNEPVLPPEVFPLFVQEGKGVILLEDRTKVVAVEKGHPDIQVKGTLAKISVVPKLLIGTDVNLQVGNVHYVGDVEVTGAVQDGMLVEAQGNILVQGNANMAAIQSGRSIIIRKNVISSELNAGKNSKLVQELIQMLGEIREQLDHLMIAMQQLTSVSTYKAASPSGNRLGPVLKLLFDGKFKSFPALVVSMCKKMKDGKEELDESWLILGNTLQKNFVTPHLSEMKTLNEVHSILKEIELLYKFSVMEDQDSSCFITANYVLNSQLYSNGDIHITGEGIYNSKLYAKGNIRIDGYVRGGEIYGEKGVTIGEAGTKGGVPTKVQAPKDQTIIISRVLEDTIIQIGNKAHTFIKETAVVRARLNEDGYLLTQ